jgi:hypothetical protein
MSATLDFYLNGFEWPHSSFVAYLTTMATGEDELNVKIGDEVGAWGGSRSGSSSPRAFPDELNGSVAVRALPAHPLLLPAPDEGGNSGHIRATVEGGGSGCIALGHAMAQVKSI